MARLFTFGCSFTSYIWPTWADILGTHFERFENWGKASHGSNFIAQRVAECDILNDLNRNDMVIIVWSDHLRFDANINQQWYPHRLSTGGNKFWDEFSGYMGSLNAIHQTQKLLQAKNVKYIMSSIKPLDLNERDFYHENTITGLFHSFPQLQVYEKILQGPQWVKPFEGGQFDYFFQSNAKAKYKLFVDDPDYHRIQLKNEIVPDDIFIDRHPTPRMHMQWLEANVLGKLGIDPTELWNQTKHWDRIIWESSKRADIYTAFESLRTGFNSISR